MLWTRTWCARFGHECKKITLPTSRPIYITCLRLCSLSGTHLPWTFEIKYLDVGTHIVSSGFKVSTEQSRRSFYRAANAIFGRIGKIATEDVVCYICCKRNVYLFCYMVLKLARWGRLVSIPLISSLGFFF